MLILRTIHGSTLYRLNHADSDVDWYEVHDTRHARRKTRQSIIDGVDTVKVDLGHWLDLADQGGHQALEAMFSPIAEVDRFAEFRANYTVNIARVSTKYQRAIGTLINTTDFKKRRHGLRLWFALDEMQRTGRFNPRLDQDQIDFINVKAWDYHWLIERLRHL